MGRLLGRVGVNDSVSDRARTRKLAIELAYEGAQAGVIAVAVEPVSGRDQGLLGGFRDQPGQALRERRRGELGLRSRAVAPRTALARLAVREVGPPQQPCELSGPNVRPGGGDTGVGIPQKQRCSRSENRQRCGALGAAHLGEAVDCRRGEVR